MKMISDMAHKKTAENEDNELEVNYLNLKICQNDLSSVRTIDVC